MTGFEPYLVAGTAAVKGVGGIMEGISQMRGQAEQGRILREQAGWERGRSEFEAGMYRNRVERSVSRDVAKRGAAGIDPNSGSALLTDVATIHEGELNAQALIREGEVRAYRYEQEADLRERAGKKAYGAGFVNAGAGSLTALSALSKYWRDAETSPREPAGTAYRKPAGYRISLSDTLLNP